MKATEYGGNKYFLTLTTAHQRNVRVYLLKGGSEKPNIAFTLSLGLIAMRNRTWKDFNPTVQLNSRAYKKFEYDLNSTNSFFSLYFES